MYLSLIYLFINSTQAFLKFSFITMSNIIELSNFSSPLVFFSLLRVLDNFFFKFPNWKWTISRKMMFHACFKANLHIFSGCKHRATGMKELFQIFLKLCMSGAVSIYIISGLAQIKKVVRLLWLTSHTSAYLPLDLKQPLYWMVPKKGYKCSPIKQADRPW